MTRSHTLRTAPKSNPSLKRSANGRPPSPVWRYAHTARMPRKRTDKAPSVVYPLIQEGLTHPDPTSPDYMGTYTPPAEYRVSPRARDLTLAEFQAMSTAEQKALPHPVWSTCMAQELAQVLIRKVMRLDAMDQKSRRAKPPQPPR